MKTRINKYKYGNEAREYVSIENNKPLNDKDIELIEKHKKVLFIGIFNQPINNLPLFITHIILLTNFNYPIDNLPETLKVLLIHSNLFNHSLDYLPNGLKKLYLLLGEFDTPILSLPTNLEVLDICCKKYKQSPINLKNINLKKLMINLNYKVNYRPNCVYSPLPMENINDNLEELTVYNYYNGCFDNLPKNIKKLHIKWFTDNNEVDLLKIPQNLEELNIRKSNIHIKYNYDEKEVEKNIKKLKILRLYEYPKNVNFVNIIPNLEYLYIHKSQNLDYLGMMPDILLDLLELQNLKLLDLDDCNPYRSINYIMINKPEKLRIRLHSIITNKNELFEENQNNEDIDYYYKQDMKFLQEYFNE